MHAAVSNGVRLRCAAPTLATTEWRADELVLERRQRPIFIIRCWSFDDERMAEKKKRVGKAGRSIGQAWQLAGCGSFVAT